jgi:hypothetical protein
VPALGVVAGRNGTPDPAFDLDAENERQQQFDAAHAAQLRQREQRRRDWSGRMDDGRDMGVAKIQNVGCGRVEKGRAQRVYAFATTDQGRLLATGKLGERLPRDLDGRGAAARERDGEEIHERALSLVPRGVRHAIPAGFDGKAGEGLRNGGCVLHGAFPWFYRSKLTRGLPRVPDAVQHEQRRSGAPLIRERHRPGAIDANRACPTCAYWSADLG